MVFYSLYLKATFIGGYFEHLSISVVVCDDSHHLPVLFYASANDFDIC